jgi:hypothetical protein
MSPVMAEAGTVVMPVFDRMTKSPADPRFTTTDAPSMGALAPPLLLLLQAVTSAVSSRTEDHISGLIMCLNLFIVSSQYLSLGGIGTNDRGLAGVEFGVEGFSHAVVIMTMSISAGFVLV